MKRGEHKIKHTGKLRIGDDWNAISIIALSQSNPLKAVAEFVENSIDAKAREVTIVRGKEKGRHYLRIVDDGEGIPRDEEGLPNFKYVATHICDSIKRHLKSSGTTGLQGEFGIGLLSFWTVGGELVLTSPGKDGKSYQMRMKKGEPNYTVQPRRTLFDQRGTELRVEPLLPGIRQFSGEKIQWYLSSELRDRIRTTGVRVTVIDRPARKQYAVEPRQFSGQLIHRLPQEQSSHGQVYLEIYLTRPDPAHRVALYRSGTRVLERLDELEPFQKEPWTSGYLEGIVDVPYLHLTPGTRTGIIFDEAFDAFCSSMVPVENALISAIDDQRKAEEEQTSHEILKSIQKAFREALLALPDEEYDWFDLKKRGTGSSIRRPSNVTDSGVEIAEEGMAGDEEESEKQRQFFEYPGPLFSVRISPASCTVAVNQSKPLQAIPRDRSRKRVEEGLTFRWEIIEGGGRLEPAEGEMATFFAPEEPALVRLRVTVSQGENVCSGEGLVTVTESLLPKPQESGSSKQGLPSYTFQRAAGELWRSRYDAERNLVVINNAHRDFVFAARSKTLKLRYICRLFSKELVYKNFPGVPPEHLLERMVELSLYSEEHLR